MTFEHYITKGTKKLRCGYTTGSCATLAAKAAARMLLTDAVVETERIITPKGIGVMVHILDISKNESGLKEIRCGVQKDGGDDWDATHGTIIYATVYLLEEKRIIIDGGVGVGRVTKKGLNQPIGEAAINETPREMIRRELEEIASVYHYEGGFKVVIDVPEGVEIAKKTFNPQLGIEGGISIIGTTGIVEPQSVQALIDTIETEVRMYHASKVKGLILTPGNYGEAFIGQYPELAEQPQVKISNYLGEALDFAATYGYEKILLVGHIGKMVKVAGGIMNTHSRYADCRNEIFAAHTALCGGSQEVVQEIMESATTDQCITILEGLELKEVVLDRIIESAQMHLEKRAAGSYQVGIVVFSNVHGLLGSSKIGKQMLDTWES